MTRLLYLGLVVAVIIILPTASATESPTSAGWPYYYRGPGEHCPAGHDILDEDECITAYGLTNPDTGGTAIFAGMYNNPNYPRGCAWGNHDAFGGLHVLINYHIHGSGDDGGTDVEDSAALFVYDHVALCRYYDSEFEFDYDLAAVFDPESEWVSYSSNGCGPQGDSGGSFSSTVECPQHVEDGTTFITLKEALVNVETTAVSTGASQFYVVNSATCEAHGKQTIMNSSTCEEYSNKYTHLTWTNEPYTTTNVPLGCFTYPSTAAKVYFHPLSDHPHSGAHDGKTSCTNTRKCICVDYAPSTDSHGNYAKLVKPHANYTLQDDARDEKLTVYEFNPCPQSHPLLVSVNGYYECRKSSGSSTSACSMSGSGWPPPDGFAWSTWGDEALTYSSGAKPCTDYDAYDANSDIFCEYTGWQIWHCRVTGDTVAPTPSPTVTVTPAPTGTPTLSPTAAPTVTVTPAPTGSPTLSTTAAPTVTETQAPTGPPVTLTPTAPTTAAPTSHEIAHIFERDAGSGQRTCTEACSDELDEAVIDGVETTDFASHTECADLA